MELKNYQKKIIDELKEYLYLIQENRDYIVAFHEFWFSRGVPKEHKISQYHDITQGSPNICFKVPTGGGKTFIATNAIKPIFENIAYNHTKSVVWLVPSDAILEQTLNNLKNPNHPYHQTLTRDFNGRVEIFSKEELLAFKGINSSKVREQVSIFVLTYDSIRSQKKDERLYRQNGNNIESPKYYQNPDSLIPNIDDTAAIQFINQLNPIVIVDESHHATTKLSIEMLRNLNPCFVLELTATPKETSNIISYTGAGILKEENMVKLPLIAYNRRSKSDVISEAIDLRNKLEEIAVNEEQRTGRYIRPIVLFQAEPKGNEDNTTFEKLKQQLIKEYNIKEENIAVKTSKVNDIKNTNLLSPNCKIRYIITVNALKEGWDCPFAYILATIANRTSEIDVEQIIGRILRQPGTAKTENKFLNLAYIFTSSEEFGNVATKIIAGLNNAGFTEKEFRVANSDLEGQNWIETLNIDNRYNKTLKNSKDHGNILPKPESNIQTGNPNSIDTILTSPQIGGTDSNLAAAEILSSQYDNNSKEYEQAGIPDKYIDDMTKSRINDEYKDEMKTFSLPQFFIKDDKDSIFNPDGYILVTKEKLGENFTLKDKSAEIDFTHVNDEIYQIDVKENTPKYMKLGESDRAYFKQIFSDSPKEAKVREAKRIMHDVLNRMDNIDSKDLSKYLDKILDNFSNDQLSDFQDNPYNYTGKIKAHIENLLDIEREKMFKSLNDSGDLVCRLNFKFKDEVRFNDEAESALEKSLYTIEKKSNGFERMVIEEVASYDNISWWHRNIERKEFAINGYFNKHYPDFIVKTKSGKIVLIETKGNYLENPDSKRKAYIGNIWKNKASNNPENITYLYFMVYQRKTDNDKGDGIYSFDEFKNIVAKL